MYEGIWLRKKLTKWQLLELRQLFPYMAFVYAWIVPLWADQLLPQLLMEQFDTLLIQCRHIEHMHEGVYNFCLHRFYWNLFKTKVCWFELQLAKFFHWLLLCGGYLISIAYWLFSFCQIDPDPPDENPGSAHGKQWIRAWKAGCTRDSMVFK